MGQYLPPPGHCSENGEIQHEGHFRQPVYLVCLAAIAFTLIAITNILITTQLMTILYGFRLCGILLSFTR